MNSCVPTLVVSLLILALRVEAQVSVIGELGQDREAKPGDTYDGVITIKNDSDEPQEAKIYQTDYTFFSNGTNNYGEPGSHPRSNARWITFSPSFVKLPPRATLSINYTVAVPKDLQGKPLVGTYWSMLMVEGIPRESPESSSGRANKRAEMGILQTIRYGIQIATHIAQSGERRVELRDPKVLPKESGGRVFQVDIENTGDIGIRPDVYLELFDEQGTPAGKFYGARFRIYPGTSVRQTIDLSTVKPGTYKTLVIVDAGADEIFAAQYNLKF